MVKEPKKIRKVRKVRTREIPEGLERVRVPGDGNCLFHAVVLQLGEKYGHKTLRKRTVAFMRANLDDYIPFIPFPKGTDAIVYAKKYLEDMENADDPYPQWGGQPEIIAMMRIFQRPIVVIRKDSPPEDYHGFEHNKPIFIYYDGIDHYDGFNVKAEHNGNEILTKLTANRVENAEISLIIRAEKARTKAKQQQMRRARRQQDKLAQAKEEKQKNDREIARKARINKRRKPEAKQVRTAARKINNSTPPIRQYSGFAPLKEAILTAIGEDKAAEPDKKETSGYRPWLLALMASRPKFLLFAHSGDGLTRAGHLYKNVEILESNTKKLIITLYMHLLSSEHRSKRHSLDTFLLRNLLRDRLLENILEREYGQEISYDISLPQDNTEYSKKIDSILEEDSNKQREILLNAMTTTMGNIILSRNDALNA